MVFGVCTAWTLCITFSTTFQMGTCVHTFLMEKKIEMNSYLKGTK